MQSLSLDTQMPPSMAEESIHTVVRSTRPLWGGWWLLCHQVPRAVLQSGLTNIFLLILSAAL
jgi:uncharacterized membrane protein (DUF106 family)